MKLTASDKKRRQYIQITGLELQELKRFSSDMVEAYGLDSRIDAYKGTRPIGFYPWDLDCLDCVVDNALQDSSEYPDKSSKEHLALKKLCEKLCVLRKKAYGGRDIV